MRGGVKQAVTRSPLRWRAFLATRRALARRGSPRKSARLMTR